MNIKRKILEMFGGQEVKDILKALDGNKTIIGTALYELPNVIDSFLQFLAVLSPVLGDFHLMVGVTFITKATGALLMVSGLLHKLQKFAEDYLDIKRIEKT